MMMIPNDDDRLMNDDETGSHLLSSSETSCVI